jgi:Mrp family chromosome partitioning ATPase/capsular polysaccharide biosynthesis protein
MRTFDEPKEPETDPLSAIRQHPLLVLGIAALFGVLGAWYALSGPAVFVSKTSLIVEDTRFSSSRSTADAERYVADQVAILQSAIVAERASALAPTLEPPADIGAKDIAGGRTITSSSESNFVEVSFVAQDPQTAQTGANAIRLAYQEVVSAALAENAEAAINRLDDAIDTTVQEIESLQTRIQSSRSGSDPQPPDARIASIVSNLVEMRDAAGEQAGAGSLTTTKELAAQSDRLSAKLSERLADDAVPSGDTRRLLRRQQDAAVLLGELTSQRTDVEVDAQLSGNGVAFFAPAGRGRREGIPLSSAALVATVLGGLVGAGAAYLLSHGGQRVEDRLAAASILGVPLLVDVRAPSKRRFGTARRRKRGRRSAVPVPVLQDPMSPPANAFRTLVAALGQNPPKGRDGANVSRLYGSTPRGTVVACVSATSREASALVAVNVALAAGQSGLRVGIIDGDMAAGDVSRLVGRLQGHHPTAGLADLIDGSVRLDDVAGWIEVRDGTDVSVLSVGSAGITAPDLFGAPKVRAILQRFANHHDLVFVNLPPVLEVAQAAALRETDQALVVVPHQTPVRHLRELRHRMDVMGVPVAGYIYTSSSAPGYDDRSAPASHVLRHPGWKPDGAYGTNGDQPYRARGSETAV